MYWAQVWKRMHELTGKDVEKRAVMEFISHFEAQMDLVIKKSAEELEKRNGFSGIQGLKPRQRIGRACVREAIKTIYSGAHSPLPARAGGKKQKETECNKHPQENTEVT